MTLSISISDSARRQLQEKANVAGVDIETYAAQQLERVAAPARSMLEISGPAYQEFLQSGMTDDELGDFLEEVKHEMRAEKRQRRAS